MPAQSLWGVFHVQGLQRYREQQTLFLGVLGYSWPASCFIFPATRHSYLMELCIQLALMARKGILHQFTFSLSGFCLWVPHQVWLF